MTGGLSFAEVIGDPVGHSLSPLIHKAWLDDHGIGADYVRTRVAPWALAAFLERRRADTLWLGCNVTIPHKESILSQLDQVEEEARKVGAVNIVVPRAGDLVGYNSDIDGIAAALGELDLGGRTAVMIGAGGAAKAAAAWLADRGLARLQLIVRDPSKAECLRGPLGQCRLEVAPFTAPARLDPVPAVVINASPLGMTGQPPMPLALLGHLLFYAPAATFFDMVYAPAETVFLQLARRGGSPTADGLTMLVGQAARAFELFYGARPGAADSRVRGLLAT